MLTEQINRQPGFGLKWLLILGGIISVLFGIGMILAQGAGALALDWVIGTYVVIIGVLLVALAFRAHKAG
jgi:uncharacterized membrane protein HdeD (DUF308 family)